MSRKMLIFLTACILCLGVVSVNLVRIQAAPDRPTDGFSLPWWTIDSGGGSSQGGAYSLRGTTGQADAGRLSGGSYILVGGFWGRSAEYVSYLPLIIH
jgi:hypothetical protein